MGTGYHDRPFKNMLATICRDVYAVDARDQARSLKIREDNIHLVIADFSKPIKEIEPSSLDLVFCLSVLEEGVDILQALLEFKRLLKPNGKIVLTFDVIRDPTQPVGIYKGVNLETFFRAVTEVGLEFAGGTDFSTQDILTNPEWNLSVFHCTLQHKNSSDKIQKEAKTPLILDWVKNNHPKGSGILSWPGDVAYPEVTGYIIPTLLAHGFFDLAKELANWLVSIQHIGGGFRGQDGKLRSFDTAACIEGLTTASIFFSEKEFAVSAERARKWIKDFCIETDGKIYSEPNKKEFRNYSLRVNGILSVKPTWINPQPSLWPFGEKPDRTHYIAYALEGLLSLGEVEKVKLILDNVENALTPQGFISYWVSSNWNPAPPFYACHNATAQIGLLLARLKIKPDLVKKLYNNLVEVVQSDGGIPTRPKTIATSWTAKWFLDFEEALKTA